MSGGKKRREMPAGDRVDRALERLLAVIAEAPARSDLVELADRLKAAVRAKETDAAS